MADSTCTRRVILLTRPYVDAQRLADQLIMDGYTCLIDSMLTIDQTILSSHQPLVIQPQACIITSKNALPALNVLKINHQIPLYVPGTNTAQLGHQLGYHSIVTGTGDAASLLPLLINQLNPKGGPIVHLSGQDIRVDFAMPLRQASFTYQRYLVYQTSPALTFKPETIIAFQQNRIAAVLLYSPKTSSHFNNLMLKRPDLWPQIAQNTAAICLSQAIADHLTIHFAKMIIAKQPCEDAIIEALKQEVKNDC